MSEANSVERRVRCVAVGVDRGLRDITAVVLAKVLADGQVEIVEMRELPRIETKPPTLPFWSAEAPPAEQLTHGPQRKGRGGKLRRW